MKRITILTIIISGLLLFYHLGKTTLVNWDEAWLASVSQDIAVRGDWLSGQWNGQTWFYEPPLVTWALAALYKIFGASEFWLRSFNAVLGILIVITTYKLSALITKSAASAFISAIILLSDIEFLFRSRQINVEIPVTFFLLFAIYSALKTFSSSPRKWWITTGVSLGLAFLTKRASPILALPAIILAAVPVSHRYLHQKNIFLMAVAFLFTAAPWYLLNYRRWGNQFTNEFFLGYTIGKIRSINPGAGINAFFYITALKHAFKLWFPLIPFAIIWATVKSFRDRKIAALTIYILTFLIFLTLAPIKSSWFLLPIHPVIAIVLGLFVNRIRSDLGVRQGRTLIKYFAIPSIIVVTIFQLIRYRHDFIVPDTTGRQAALAKLAGQLTPPEKPIYLDDDYLPVAVFYSRRRVIPLRFNRLQPITPLPIPSESYIFTNNQTYPALKRQYPKLISISSLSDLILVRLE